MTEPQRSTEERLSDLQIALETRTPKSAAPIAQPAALSKTAVPGPKTALTLEILAWIFRIFWFGWIVLAIASDSRGPGLHWLPAIAFSGLIFWLIFQFYKAMLLWTVGKASKNK